MMKEELKETFKKLARNLFAITFLLTIFLSFFNVVIKNEENKTSNYIKNWVNQANKETPIQVDSFTILSNFIQVIDNTIQINYILSEEFIEKVNLEEATTKIKEVAKNNLKSSENIKELAEKNIIVSYKYSDQSGNKLFNFSITPEEYGK